MAETLLFELVSPQRLLVSEEVEMAVVPGTCGYFGALPRHAPLISTLEPGVIDIYRGGEIASRIFVTGGFAEVNETSCTVLAEEAFALTELSMETVLARIEAAQKRIDEASDDALRDQAQRVMRAALAMRAAVEGGGAVH